MDNQEYHSQTIYLRKKKVSPKDQKTERSMFKTVAQGGNTSIVVKGAQNKNTSQNVDFHKLDNNTDAGKHDKVSLSVGKLIMKGRQAKNMSQKELAQKINEKPTVINSYEQSKAIPNQQILGKIEKQLGIKLRGKNIGEPLNIKRKK